MNHRIKKALVLLFTVLGVVFAFGIYPNQAKASTNGHTQAEAVAWANSKVGQALDFDGKYGAQCVDFTCYYYQYLGQATPWGNANQYLDGGNFKPAGWSYVSSPQPGDIAVWTTGDVGHVAIVTEIRGSQMVCVEQNFAGKQYVTPNLHNIDAQGYIRPDFRQENQNPIGCLDSATGDQGSIMIAGWTFDPDEPSKQLSIHVYIDGPAGSGSFLGSATACTLRQDVDDAYQTGAYHGFVANFSASPGKHDIYVYAIDSAGGNNPQLGKATVNVPAVDDSRRVLPDGDYAIVLTSTLESNPFYYLDVYGTDLPAASGTNVDIAGSTKTPTSLPKHELWSIKWKNGYYEITQIGTNLALDVASAGVQNNANVKVFTSNGGANQQWTISKNGDGYRIKSRGNGRSLDNQNGLLEQANNVAVHDDNDSVAQRWSFIPVNRVISQATVSSIANQTYTGSAITPKPTVKWSGTTLVNGTDYTLSYSNNTAVGTATITITGKGSYTGTKTVTFKIVSGHAAGWAKEDDAYYYYDANGLKVKNNWASYEGTWYYLGSDGKVVTNGWATYEGVRYYMGANGKVTVNNWVNDGGVWYYMGSNGQAVVNDWVSYNGKWYFMDADGHPLVDAWHKYNDTWYYFGSAGYCTRTMKAS